ncbi:CBS domain-containing protein (plasmid) [Rossellomorea sp. AcN35-11]|nr:CBS domain-containing protein [Rossellomorea aquimaris]WJV32354.1 CBS domain-containing protein [Rossellomorea sp. AcN35-11]
MFVKSVMKDVRKCFFVEKDAPIKVALDKLEEQEIDAVPVLDKDKYAGMVTRNSIYKAFFERSIDREEFLKNKKVSEIVINQELSVDETGVFEEVLVLVQDSPIVPVVDENMVFKGLVTRYDAIEQFQSAFGMNTKGVRITFTSVETEGRIAKLAQIARQYHEQIISLTTFDESDKLVRRIVMKIEDNPNLEKFLKKLESHGFRVLDVKKN